MKSLRAFVLLVLSLPLLGGDDLTGEGGVWILPSFIQITSSWHHILQQNVSEARAHKEFTDFNEDIAMQLPDGMGPTLGTCHVPATGQVFGLPVQGNVATVSSQLIQDLFNGGVEQAEVLLLDQHGRGLAILLVFDREQDSLDAYVF